MRHDDRRGPARASENLMVALCTRAAPSLALKSGDDLAAAHRQVIIHTVRIEDKVRFQS
jgi:hypothetical protein